MLRLPARRTLIVDAESCGTLPPSVARRSTLRALLLAAPLLAGAGCSSSAPDRGPAASASSVARVSSSHEAVQAALAPGLPPCRAEQLTLALDAGNGRFDGMSHSGTSLLLRNAGPHACTVPAHPSLQFGDADGHATDIVVQAATTTQAKRQPASVIIAPGDRVGSDLRWVSGNVYENGHCEAPTRIRLVLDGGAVSAAFAGHLCGAGGKPSFVTMTPFAKPAPHE